MTEDIEMDVDISPLPGAESNGDDAMDPDDTAQESAMMAAAQDACGRPRSSKVRS